MGAKEQGPFSWTNLRRCWLCIFWGKLPCQLHITWTKQLIPLRPCWGNYFQSCGLRKKVSSSSRQSFPTCCLIWPTNNARIRTEAHTELETHCGNGSTSKMTCQSQALKNMPVTVLFSASRHLLLWPGTQGMGSFCSSKVSVFQHRARHSVAVDKKCIRKRTAPEKILIWTLHSFNFEVSGILFRVRSSNSRFRQIVIVIFINLSVRIGKCCLVSWLPLL